MNVSPDPSAPEGGLDFNCLWHKLRHKSFHSSSLPLCSKFLYISSCFPLFYFDVDSLRGSFFLSRTGFNRVWYSYSLKQRLSMGSVSGRGMSLSKASLLLCSTSGKTYRYSSFEINTFGHCSKDWAWLLLPILQNETLPFFLHHRFHRISALMADGVSRIYRQDSKKKKWYLDPPKGSMLTQDMSSYLHCWYILPSVFGNRLVRPVF